MNDKVDVQVKRTNGTTSVESRKEIWIDGEYVSSHTSDTPMEEVICASLIHDRLKNQDKDSQIESLQSKLDKAEKSLQSIYGACYKASQAGLIVTNGDKKNEQ